MFGCAHPRSHEPQHVRCARDNMPHIGMNRGRSNLHQYFVVPNTRSRPASAIMTAPRCLCLH